MDSMRLKRYKDKINYIVDSFIYFSKVPSNELEKRGIFYSVQTAIESLIDIIAMLNRDLGLPVKDDEKNIIQIIQKFNLDIDLGEGLKKMNGMRNIIVHRYNGIEESIIIGSLNEISKLTRKWLDVVEEILNEINPN